MYRPGGEASEAPHGWLINQAVYRGALAWQASSERLVLTEMKAIFDLRVFGRVMRVRIPLQREAANLAIEQVLLDGREVQPQWDPDSGNPVILVAEPGPYRLEIVLRPGLHTLGPQTGWDFAIPSLANSRLELAVPLGAPTIDIPSALGLVHREEESSRVIAALGPASRLTVAWQQGARRSSAGTTVDVEELIWLKVRPGSVVLDAKFKFHVIEGHLRELQLAADPRLRLLPSKQVDLPIAEVQTVAGQPQTIRFQLARPVADQAVLGGQFSLDRHFGRRQPSPAGTGSPGSAAGEAIRRRFHRPVPGLRRTGAGSLGDHGGERFSGRLGTAENPPQFAFRPAAEQSSWSLSTRPRKPHTLVDQVLALSFTRTAAPRSTTMRSSPRPRAIASSIACWRPTNWKSRVFRCSTAAGARCALVARPRPSHACSSAAPSAASSPWRCGAGSRLPPRKSIASAAGEIRPGRDRAKPSMIQSSMIQLYRRPSVNLDVDHLHGLSQLDSGSIEPTKKDLGRLVKTFTADGKEPIRAMVSLKPNQPIVRSEQTIRLAPTDRLGRCKPISSIDVQDGLLDQIKITAPGPGTVPIRSRPRGAQDRGPARRSAAVADRAEVGHERQIPVEHHRGRSPSPRRTDQRARHPAADLRRAEFQRAKAAITACPRSTKASRSSGSPKRD